MADPVSYGPEFTVNDAGDLKVRATERTWPYGVTLSEYNGLMYDEDGLFTLPAPVLHPLRERWNNPALVTIADGGVHQVPGLEVVWANPAASQVLVDLYWALRIECHAPDAAGGRWEVLFTDPEAPMLDGPTATMSARSGSVQALCVPHAMPTTRVPGHGTYASRVMLTVTNHTGTDLTLLGWTVRAAGFAIEGAH
ncbi:hypothetical protein RCO28_38005 [Streptomyces sp. LHD-70]|uniref:hypothetical protein n=1 Tax=Streptomyces sp. LHD-70 TaxID=3072140 RepID=UPI00281036BA|nr:hypothetical protein [Streptomyces sp. LHD-70]MDQ8708213.1 hypothetical protein [Streptomyces sp. LHD-70]